MLHSGQRTTGIPTIPMNLSMFNRGIHMATVTVSSRFHIVIPRELRDALGLKPGQRFQAFQFQDRIELVPWISMRKARGMFKGIDTDIERERS